MSLFQDGGGIKEKIVRFGYDNGLLGYNVSKEDIMKDSKGTKAAKKAWKTMRANEAKMTDAELQALHRQRSQAAKKAWRTIRANDRSAVARKAAHKAWKTMRRQESKMDSVELKALHFKRSRAAKKAWKTIRAKAA